MMNNKRNILTIAFVAIAFLAFSLTLSSYQTKQNSMLKFMNDNYPELWEQVDSLDRLGQPKSALEIINKIYK